MRNTYQGEYSENWAAISRETKDEAGWKCVRCRHPFDALTGRALPCSLGDCDENRGIHLRSGLLLDFSAIQGDEPPDYSEWLGKLSLTVHHFDGDKSNNRWWNRMALCNSCHLKIQSSVIPERPWLLEHSQWAMPYVGGFYAWWFAQQEPTRAQVEYLPEFFLALGQPWAYSNFGIHTRRYIEGAPLEDVWLALRTSQPLLFDRSTPLDEDEGFEEWRERMGFRGAALT